MWQKYLFMWQKIFLHLSENTYFSVWRNISSCSRKYVYLHVSENTYCISPYGRNISSWGVSRCTL
jgi:hypothetical protein